jgi:hypothetical protein
MKAMIAAAMMRRLRVGRFMLGQTRVDVVGIQRKSLKKFRKRGKGRIHWGKCGILTV